jgi:hypothetical protein
MSHESQSKSWIEVSSDIILIYSCVLALMLAMVSVLGDLVGATGLLDTSSSQVMVLIMASVVVFNGLPRKVPVRPPFRRLLALYIVVYLITIVLMRGSILTRGCGWTETLVVSGLTLAVSLVVDFSLAWRLIRSEHIATNAEQSSKEILRD